MFKPLEPSAGPTGGAGLAAPALIWSLMNPVTSFAIDCLLFFCYLSKAEFQQGFSAEDHNYNFEFASVFLYRIYCSAETAERAVCDLDRLSDFKIDFRL